MRGEGTQPGRPHRKYRRRGRLEGARWGCSGRRHFGRVEAPITALRGSAGDRTCRSLRRGIRG